MNVIQETRQFNFLKFISLMSIIILHFTLHALKCYPREDCIFLPHILLKTLATFIELQKTIIRCKFSSNKL